MWGCVLTPTEGSVPLRLAALHVPLCHLPQEKGQTEKFIYLEREAMPPGVMVYTKAPLEGSGLLKGCYRDQQVPAARAQQEPPSGCVPTPAQPDPALGYQSTWHQPLTL